MSRKKQTHYQIAMNMLRKGEILQGEAAIIAGKTRVTIWSSCKELGINPKKARKRWLNNLIKMLKNRG